MVVNLLIILDLHGHEALLGVAFVVLHAIVLDYLIIFDKLQWGYTSNTHNIFRVGVVGSSSNEYLPFLVLEPCISWISQLLDKLTPMWVQEVVNPGLGWLT